MPEPKDYFQNPREADLANRVWQLSEKLPGYWRLSSTHPWFANKPYFPWINTRIIYARDWITNMREGDDVGGVELVNRQFKSDFTAIEIANVEHFYVAALLGTIGGPVGGVVLNAIGDSIWEMAVGPTRIAWNCALRYSAKDGARILAHNIKDNWNQLTGPDWAGTRFGSFFPFTDFLDEVNPPAQRSPKP